MSWRPAPDLEPLNRLLIKTEQALLSIFRQERDLESFFADELIDELFKAIDSNPLQAALMGRIKSGHTMTPRHGINVLCLARAWAVTAHKLGNNLRDFSLAALLHDLGHWRPNSLVYVFDYFTHDQARLLRKHPHIPEPEASVFPEPMLTWIAQHHEQPDGKGYPLGIKDPHPLSQVLRIADIYDGLTTPRRFRPAHTPYRAMEIMRRWSGRKFDRRLFLSFEQFLGHYPAGTFIHLNNGSIAISLPPALDKKLQEGLCLTNQVGDALAEPTFVSLSPDNVSREAFSWHDLKLPETWKNLRPDLLALPRYYS